MKRYECNTKTEISIKKTKKTLFSNFNQPSVEDSKLDSELFSSEDSDSSSYESPTCEECGPPDDRNSCSMKYHVTTIPSWKDDPTFLNERKCNRSMFQDCGHCLNLMFSVRVRGKPPISLEWLRNFKADSVSSPRYDKYRATFQTRIYKFMRPHEINLRLIPRHDVLQDLLLRFRGYKAKKEDTIDKILQTHAFSSLEDWMHWKTNHDEMIALEFNSVNLNLLYCSGCGDKCISFQPNSCRNTTFQKCSNNACSFFYKEDATFAKVKEP